jgi:hypothetical protein
MLRRNEQRTSISRCEWFRSGPLQGFREVLVTIPQINWMTFNHVLVAFVSARRLIVTGVKKK